GGVVVLHADPVQLDLPVAIGGQREAGLGVRPVAVLPVHGDAGVGGGRARDRQRRPEPRPHGAAPDTTKLPPASGPSGPPSTAVHTPGSRAASVPASGTVNRTDAGGETSAVSRWNTVPFGARKSTDRRTRAGPPSTFASATTSVPPGVTWSD